MLPQGDEERNLAYRLMKKNATIFPAKIKGAMGMYIDSLLMENAVIIKINYAVKSQAPVVKLFMV